MTDSSPSPGQATEPFEVDTGVPHSARIWNYWLGGKDNFPVDREAGDEFARSSPRSSTSPAPPGSSWAAPSGTWPARPGSASSWTSAPACPPPTTPTRSPSGWPRTRGSSTSTTTRWCWSTPAPCSPAPPRAPPPTSTPTCTTPTRSWQAAAETLDFTQPIALMLLGVLGHVERLRRGALDREAADGRGAVRQLPGALRRHQHPPGIRGGPAAATTRAARSPTTAQPRADRRLLRGTGAGGARRGVMSAVATRSRRPQSRPAR